MWYWKRSTKLEVKFILPQAEFVLLGNFSFAFRAFQLIGWGPPRWSEIISFQFSSVQSSRSVVSDSLRPHESQHARPPCPSPSPGVHSDSRPSSPWCHPAISSSVVPFSGFQSFPASGSFPTSVLHIRWPKYWRFNFSISPSNEYSGLISFWIDWLDLLAIPGTLKNLLQKHNSKALILWPSVFFMVQLSHLYMTTGKTIALTIWTFVGKVMSLFLNILSVCHSFSPKEQVFFNFMAFFLIRMHLVQWTLNSFYLTREGVAKPGPQWWGHLKGMNHGLFSSFESGQSALLPAWLD